LASTRLRYIAIIGSLAVLVIILVPAISSPFQSQNNNGNLTSDIKPPQPQDISDEDLNACSSLDGGIQFVLGVRNNTGNPANGTAAPASFTNLSLQEQKIASDLMTGEFCNRAELVHQLVNASDPGIMGVAYACAAASGKIGDTALQQSLSDFTEFYCDSAKQAINNETSNLLQQVESFKADVLPKLQNDNATAAASAEESLGELIADANRAKELVDSSTYEAAISLDHALLKFANLVEIVSV